MRNSDVLQKKLDKVVRTAEVPYQANRRALKVLDILNDGTGGLQEVDVTLRGIEMLIEDLNDLRLTAKRINKSSLAQLRKASGGISELPAYGKLRSVPAFSSIAVGVAKIEKAIAEMRKTEDFLMRGQTTKAELNKGLDDIAYFSGLIADEAMKAISALRTMANGISSFERELIDAVS